MDRFDAVLRSLLTPQRLRYAWILGGVLWATWLLSLALGPGLTDMAGQVIGTDYLQFYAAGTTLRQGEGARLYELDYQARLEQALIGPELRNYHAFITPPFLAWLFVPFAALPYAASFALWSLLGLVLLALGLAWLGPAPLRKWLWAVTWFPVFAAISFGQNSLLSFFLLALVYRLWSRERLWAAGLACSLLMYKPQLALGVGLLWLLNWRRDWRALVAWGAGSAALAGLCFGLLPEASRAYVEFSRTVLPDLPAWKDFPLWHLHTVRGFARLLLPGLSPWADGLALLVGAAGCLGFWGLERRLRPQPALRFAAAVALTFWLTPHAMIYDWVLLLIPAVLLWEALPDWRIKLQGRYAVIWLVTLLSGPLTYGQVQAGWPLAIQISVPVFLGLTLIWGRELFALPSAVQSATINRPQPSQ